jgi:hypothetical protein
MLRKILITLAALAAATALPTGGALARGGMGGMGGMSHGGMGGMGGMGRAGMGIGHASFAHGPGFVGTRPFSAARPIAFTGHFAHNRPFFFRHHFHNRFFFAAGFPYAYGYYDDGCWTRVWTPWGWRWRSVCY